MEIIQSNGQTTSSWQRLPVVPQQYEKYMHLFEQFPCIDLMMVGSLNFSHYTFMRQTKQRGVKPPCDLSIIAKQCKEVIMEDKSLGTDYVLQAWQGARTIPIHKLKEVTPLVIVSGILVGNDMKISVSVKK